jgi:hypothetical protein
MQNIRLLHVIVGWTGQIEKGKTEYHPLLRSGGIIMELRIKLFSEK